jgi:predicted ArsR family transcriptional regulator
MPTSFHTHAAKVRIDAILDALEDGPLTAHEMAGVTQCSPTTIRRYIPHLVRDLKRVRVVSGEHDGGVGHPELAYALIDGKPVRTDGARVYSQFARYDVEPPIIRRDPLVAAFFGGV